MRASRDAYVPRRRDDSRSSWLLEQVELRWKRIILFLLTIFFVILAHLLITTLLKDPPNWLQGELLTFFQAVLILSFVSILIFSTLFIKYHQFTQRRIRALEGQKEGLRRKSVWRCNQPVILISDVAFMKQPLWPSEGGLLSGYAPMSKKGSEVVQSSEEEPSAAVPEELIALEKEINLLKMNALNILRSRMGDNGRSSVSLDDDGGGCGGEMCLQRKGCRMEQWLRKDLQQWRLRLEQCGPGGSSEMSDMSSDNLVLRREPPLLKSLDNTNTLHGEKDPQNETLSDWGDLSEWESTVFLSAEEEYVMGSPKTPRRKRRPRRHRRSQESVEKSPNALRRVRSKDFLVLPGTPAMSESASEGEVESVVSEGSAASASLLSWTEGHAK